MPGTMPVSRLVASKWEGGGRVGRATLIRRQLPRARSLLGMQRVPVYLKRCYPMRIGAVPWVVTTLLAAACVQVNSTPVSSVYGKLDGRLMRRAIRPLLGKKHDCHIPP